MLEFDNVSKSFWTGTQRKVILDQASFRVELGQSLGLESWTGGMIPVSRVPDGAGRFTSTWRTTEPVGAGLRRFVRIKATLR